MILGMLARSFSRAAGWLGFFPTMRIRGGEGRGLRIGLRFADRDYIAGTKEMPVQSALAEQIRPGDVVFDIGANIGFLSLIAARLAGDEGHVYAFEPQPENIACLRRNLRANNAGNCTVLAFALSDRAGQEALLLSKQSGGSTISAGDKPPDFAGTLMVRVATADDLVGAGEVRPPDFVKLDVEGAEMHVLRGMRSVIGTYRPGILFEVDDRDEQALERKFGEIRLWLEKAGYAVSRIEDSYPDIDWCVAHGLALPRETPPAD
jgi:FkbM family methyltransferase